MSPGPENETINTGYFTGTVSQPLKFREYNDSKFDKFIIFFAYLNLDKLELQLSVKITFRKRLQCIYISRTRLTVIIDCTHANI